MNVCVFLASSDGKSPEFGQRTAEIGKALAQHGHSLVFGGTNSGLMKILCDNFLEISDDVTGVEPDVEFIRENAHPGLKKVIYTQSMAERKNTMINMANAIIVMPGGPGSFDESGDVLQLLKIASVDIPLVYVNTSDFYEPLKTLFGSMQREGFWGIEEGRVLFSDDVDEIMKFIETPLPARKKNGV